MSKPKIATSHRGRKCKTPGCRRALSIYNHEAHCHVHLQEISKLEVYRIPLVGVK